MRPVPQRGQHDHFRAEVGVVPPRDCRAADGVAVDASVAACERAKGTMTPTDRWSALVGSLVLYKQRIVELDPGSPFTYRLPRVGASLDSGITDFDLDPAHRDLLITVNGWPDLNLGLQLLSVDDLTAGPLFEVWRSRLQAYLGEQIDGWSATDVHPVAVSDDDRDLVVIGRPGTSRAGRVAWLDGGVVAEYGDLEAWFYAIIEMHRQEIDELQGVTKPAGRRAGTNAAAPTCPSLR